LVDSLSTILGKPDRQVECWCQNFDEKLTNSYSAHTQ